MPWRRCAVAVGNRSPAEPELAPYGETGVDGARIVNLPAYLLERLVKRDARV